MAARQRLRPNTNNAEDQDPDVTNAGSNSAPKRKSQKPNDKLRDASGIGILDVLRVLGGIFVLNCALSWFVTGDSILWGYRPWFTRVGEVKAWWAGPVSITDAELAAYDGSDAEKPVYVALDGDIFDVSANRRVYGPGGPYHFFAGRDAARAYVTGCFETDLTPDLRGVEEMFIPVDPEPSAEQELEDLHSGPAEEEVDGELRRKGGRSGAPKVGPKEELKKRNEREIKEARDKVRATIDGWKKTFRGETGKPYFWVGKVKRESGWLQKLPRRELCEPARKQRPKRKQEASE